MRAVDAVMECLKAEGVEVVFGLPGGANLPTYDAFVDAGIRHVLVRHEAGGGHAAEGYAKATGKVGVAFATSGPGATNLVTPIVDAMMDSVPTVFITGQVRTDLLGTDGFQEADTIGITDAGRQAQLHDPARRWRSRGRSTRRSTSRARGRPGPVVVDIPVGPLRARTSPTSRSPTCKLPGYQPTTDGNTKQIRQAAKALAAARRPVHLRGRRRRQRQRRRGADGVRHADRFPVTCTLMGLGAFPAPHPQWLGMLGMHGTRAANYAMDEADLICCVGARFDDRITGKLSEFAPRAKFIHIDVDPAEISKNVPAHIPIVGDARERPGQARSRSTARWRASTRRAWTSGGAAIDGWRDKHPLRYDDSDRRRDQAPVHDPGALRGHGRRRDRHLATSASTRCGRRSTSTSTKPRRWINSGGLGTMGFGLPAAMGAPGRLPGRDRRLHRRRRLGPDEHAGARDLRPERHPDQGVHHEQRLPGHGPPVAGAVLGQALLPGRHGPVPGLRQARRGLRRDRHALRPTRPRSSTT